MQVRITHDLEPSLREGEYAFATAEGGTAADGLQPLATFVEEEGLSLIVEPA